MEDPEIRSNESFGKNIGGDTNKCILPRKGQRSCPTNLEKTVELYIRDEEMLKATDPFDVPSSNRSNEHNNPKTIKGKNEQPPGSVIRGFQKDTSSPSYTELMMNNKDPLLQKGSVDNSGLPANNEKPINDISAMDSQIQNWWPAIASTLTTISRVAMLHADKLDSDFNTSALGKQCEED